MKDDSSHVCQPLGSQLGERDERRDWVPAAKGATWSICSLDIGAIGPEFDDASAGNNPHEPSGPKIAQWVDSAAAE
jgi:hypothetical protein